MADISKITLPNGQSYNIKDTTARSTGKVSGVKGDKESSYRMGNVNLTPENIGAIPTGAVMSTNPFAGNRGSSLLYIPKIDNALYCADKRFNVNVSGDYSIFQGNATLFDGNYDSQVLRVIGDNQVTVSISFEDTNTGYFPGYPYGYIFLTFYHIRKPQSVTGRVYCNYEPHTVGWHNLQFSNNFGSVYVAKQSVYNISLIEITFNGAEDGDRASLAEIDMWLDRPSPRNTPFVSKYSAETLYYNLTAPKFIGDLQGNASTATKVNNHTVESDVPANAQFTDTTYSNATSTSAGLMSADDKNIVDGISSTYATKAESQNHIVASKTQPTDQQAGDIWLVLS